MLLDTHISMPRQDPMAENNFSLLPRELRKWLKNLPYVDQDMAVQQFYDGLKRSNRQAHTTKRRLIAMEIMRPAAHDFLKSQRKYLLSQPFPLSKKTTEVLKLQQNILNELAVAYKIIIQETVNRENHLSSKKLVTCVHHAMHYQLEQYVTLAQVYSEPPQSFWKDLCQLYCIAEHFNLTGLQIRNEIDLISPKSSPKILFTNACLLYLSNLHTYGHGEAGKIAAYLNEVSQLTNITDNLPTNCEYTFYINLALAKPVRIMPDDEIPMSTKNRYIDASGLVDKLKKTAISNKNDKQTAIRAENTLNKSLSKRLLKKLISKPIRSSKRAVSAKGRLHVVMGMRDAIEILLTGYIISKDTADSVPRNPNLELMPIDNSRISTFFNDNHSEEENNYLVSSSNAWDWVGRGNVVTEQKDRKPTDNDLKKSEKFTLNPVIQTWDISNASKGGYCLNSSNTSDYQSQVGDIILIRVEDKLNDEWRLGVIRWMQSLTEQGVKIGIETLHGNVEVLEILEANLNSTNGKEFDYILQINEKTASGINKTIIVPPNSAAIGDRLIVSQHKKQKNIVFQRLLEQTISFARFSYSEMPVMPTAKND